MSSAEISRALAILAHEGYFESKIAELRLECMDAFNAEEQDMHKRLEILSAQTNLLERLAVEARDNLEGDMR